jgi:hypothetical protein
MVHRVGTGAACKIAQSMSAESDEKSGYMPYRDRHPVVVHEAALGIGMPSDKSVGAALLLTFLFGPFGLFYASVLGGVVMLALAIVIGVATLGLGLPLVWFGSMIWGAVAASSKHSRHQLWLVQQIGQGRREE